jgi:hypothetical protein
MNSHRHIGCVRRGRMMRMSYDETKFFIHFVLAGPIKTLRIELHQSLVELGFLKIEGDSQLVGSSGEVEGFVESYDLAVLC